MIGSIHQSMLGTASRCGEQFRRRYIENEIIPPGVAMVRGTAVHRANEVNLRQKIRTKRDLPLSDLKDAARDGYMKALEDGVFLPKDQIPAKARLLNDGLNEAISLTGLYHKEVAPQICPIEVERYFELRAPGVTLPLAGTIDIEQDGRVDDLKTSSKKWPDDQISREIQPVLYSWANEKITGHAPTFYYHILRALKGGPQLQVQSMVATAEHYRALFARIQAFEKMLISGIFPPAFSGAWWCSPQFCGFYASCRYTN